MNVSAVETQLQAQLQALQHRLAQLNKDLSSAHSPDSQEQALERENDEVLEELASETMDSITAVQSALHRIESGEYGVCVTCGEPIAQERLMALPETSVCIYCAN